MKAVILMLWLSFVLLGCSAVGPDYRPPNPAVPKQWSGSNGAAGSTLPEQWWRIFNDPVLNQLISDAVSANLDLKQALLRVKDTRAQRVAVFAAALPAISAKSNVSRRLNSSSTGSQSGGIGSGFGIGDQIINIFQAGFDAQWELDFFGGVKRAAEAADATVASEIENSRDVLVTLQAEVARNYLELRANQAALAIAEKNLANQQDTLHLTEIRQQSGLSDSLAVAQAQAQVAATAAEIPGYQVMIKQSIHALSVLLGREPNALSSRYGLVGNGNGNADIVPLAPADTVIPDLPSELLKRRPDIRRAERLLAAATANIGIATAEMYPKFNLSAFLGIQNTSIRDVTPVGKSWSTAASVTMPIFNWGRLKANVKSKQAQAEQVMLNYRATVLRAFKEVEDALTAYTKEQERHDELTKAVAANALAVQLAKERYQKGLTGFLDVLHGQQSLYVSQTDLISSKAAISTHLVALYKALGGGWQKMPGADDACKDCGQTLAERIYQQTKALGLH